MKKISPVVVVGMLLTIGCLVVYRAETTLAQKLSFYAYDAFLNAIHDEPQSHQVAIVDIDDQSLKAVGQWPWSRYLVAAMTAGILEQGASVVAFDVVFPEKDRTSPAVLREVLNQDFGLDVKIEGLPDDLQDFDARFAMILEAGNTILGCFMHQATNFTAEADASGDPFFRSRIFTMAPDRRAAAFNNIVLLAADSVMASIPSLDKVTETAFFNAVPDFDNVVRSNPLVMALGDKRIYPSLALEAVRMHVGASKCILHYDERGVLDIQVGDLVIPTDHRGRLVVNYRKVNRDARSGFFSSFPMYSALDVLSGSLPEGALKGKIVFVGTSAVGLKDMRATPLTGDFSGVEIHATMVDNILEGDMLRVPWWLSWIQALVILVVGVFLTILISRGRSWLSFLISTLVIVGAIGITLLLFRHYHYAFVPAWVVFSVIIIYPVLTTRDQVRGRAARQTVFAASAATRLADCQRPKTLSPINLRSRIAELIAIRTRCFKHNQAS